MNKFINWLKESNRYKHLIGGVMWASFFCVVAVLLIQRAMPSMWLSVLSAAGIGAALEFKDKQHGSTFDSTDFYCTLMGGAIASLLIALISLIWVSI